MAILKGSERRAPRGAKVTGPADPDENITVHVTLRRQNPDRFAGALQQRRRISREDFANTFGASPQDVALVCRLAGSHGIQVTGLGPDARTLELSGTVARFQSAFGAVLDDTEFPDGKKFRTRVGGVHLPDWLDGVVEAVHGLDNRPVASPRFRRHAIGGRCADHTQYTPVQVAGFYDFPAGDGRGQTIAIIELGGGYRPSDLNTYFSGLGIAAPEVVAIPTGSAGNSPTGDPDGPDGEVGLDIEIAGAIAPGATIAVYFGDNTTAGFLTAINTAIHDTVRRPSVISISWGGPENSWTGQDFATYDAAFQAAALLGVTVTVASGDQGSDDGAGDGAGHVDFPGSSPHVLCCGGTTLRTSGSKAITETVWNGGPDSATGGGISDIFPLPSWQEGLGAPWTRGGTEALVSFRGVPDVASVADPDTGFETYIDGEAGVIGGTSAAAPLWAALIARINALHGTTAGFANPQFYAAPSSFNGITVGNNGAFAAGPGWDACTGLGSPRGTNVAALYPPPPEAVTNGPTTPVTPGPPAVPPVAATTAVVLTASTPANGTVALAWTATALPGVNVAYLVEMRGHSPQGQWAPAHLTNQMADTVPFSSATAADCRVVALSAAGIRVSNVVTVNPATA